MREVKLAGLGVMAAIYYPRGFILLHVGKAEKLRAVAGARMGISSLIQSAAAQKEETIASVLLGAETLGEDRVRWGGLEGG